MADMPFKVADKGASGGALGKASRADLERGFTRLEEDDEAREGLLGIDSPAEEAAEGEGTIRLHDGPKNQLWTETDAGGFLGRPHGLER